MLSPADARMKEARYRKILLLLLLGGLTVTNLDRQVLGLAMEPIKLDLSLTDTELGFLSGIAFALFYSIVGFPIARLADRGDRAILISVTTVLSCVAVALCGVAASFVQLLIIRVVVAVGETGFIPTANSLIAEYFNRDERPKALSTYFLGGPISVIVGYFAGGWLIEYYGWRTAFLATGCPGIILAILIWFYMREPRRVRRAMVREAGGRRGRRIKVGERASSEIETAEGEGESSRSNPSVSFGEFLTFVWGSATFRQLVYSYAVMSFFDYGRSQWLPTFFIRSFGLDPGSVGTWLAVFFGMSGFVGIYLGGWLTTRYAANDERFQLRAMAAIFVLNGILSAASCLTSRRDVAIALTALNTIGASITSAPFFAILQAMVPDRMRAQATAFVLLVSNLVGMGLGPLAAGVLSDLLHEEFGLESLRYTLLLLSPGYLWCMWHTWRAGDTVALDLGRVATQAATTVTRKLTRKTPAKAPAF